MFLIDLPIGVVGLVLGVLLVPKFPARRRGRGMDLVGVALLGGGITSIMLPLIEQEQGGAAVHWWLLGLAAALLVAFVFWERWWKGRGLDPLVNLSLLRTPLFGASSLVGLAYFAGIPACFSSFPCTCSRGAPIRRWRPARRACRSRWDRRSARPSAGGPSTASDGCSWWPGWWPS